MKRYLSLILLLAVAMLSLCSCRIIPSPKEKTVESIVSQTVPESAHCVTVRDEKEFVYYTFKSDLRDLTFEVVAIQNEGGLGYKERVEYSKAVREHYKNDIYNELKSCSCFKSRREDLENAAFVFEFSSDEDAAEIIKCIAKLNRIVSDQLKYTPDADLTSSKVMNFRMEINKTGSGSDNAITYVLNGLDDEEAVYRKICIN